MVENDFDRLIQQSLCLNRYELVMDPQDELFLEACPRDCNASNDCLLYTYNLSRHPNFVHEFP